MPDPSRPLAAAEALRHLAAFGLPGGCEQPMVVDDLGALLTRARAARVLQHLYAAATAGMVANATDDWSAALRRRAMDDAATTLAAHGTALLADRRLKEAGIEPIFLKGVATGHLDYERATDRSTSDVDLLIGSHDLDRVRRVFADRTEGPHRSNRWFERFGHAATMYGDVDLDVHIRLTEGFVGLRVPPPALVASTDRFRIASCTELHALDGPNRLIHAAVHTRPDDPGLHGRRDIPQLLFVSKVDWRVAVERSLDWGIDHFVAVGVRLAWRSLVLADHPLATWAERYRPRGRSRVVRAVAGERHRGHRAAAPLALPPTQWAAYLWPQFVPSRTYAERYDLSWRRRLRVATTELRQATVGRRRTA